MKIKTYAAAYALSITHGLLGTQHIANNFRVKIKDIDVVSASKKCESVVQDKKIMKKHSVIRKNTSVFTVDMGVHFTIISQRRKNYSNFMFIIIANFD